MKRKHLLFKEAVCKSNIANFELFHNRNYGPLLFIHNISPILIG